MPFESRSDGGQAILLVEDDTATATLQWRALTNAGWNVTVAGTVGKARRLIRNKIFSAILIDLKLGRECGWQLVDEARAAQPFAPVVVVTGAEVDSVAAEALARGAS